MTGVQTMVNALPERNSCILRILSGTSPAIFSSGLAKRFPNKTAIHFMGKELTYNKFMMTAVTFAGYLQDLGITKGDRVAIMLPNSPQSVISYFGFCLRVELLCKPIHYIRNVNSSTK